MNKTVLPNERRVITSIRQNFSAPIGDAEDFLRFSIDLPKRIDLHDIGFPHDSVVAVIGLYVKASVSYRAIIRLCECGLERSSQPLSRSLFENFIYLAFLLRRRVVLYRFASDPKQPLPLFGMKLTPKFRTALYNAWTILRDEHTIQQWAKTPGMKQQGKKTQKVLNELERPYVDQIGAEWEKRIRKANTCVGLPIADFAASLGPTCRLWHRLVYASDSQTVHQSDLLSFLDADEQGNFSPRWFTSPDQVANVLQQASTIYLGCVEELNKRFRFGDDVQPRLRSFSEKLMMWF